MRWVRVLAHRDREVVLGIRPLPNELPWAIVRVRGLLLATVKAVRRGQGTHFASDNAS